MKIKVTAVVLLFFCSLVAQASSKNLQLRLKDIDDPIPEYRLEKSAKSITKGSSMTEVLHQVELQVREEKFDKCSKTLAALKVGSNSHLKYWVYRKKLLCDIEVVKADKKNNKNNIKELSDSLDKAIRVWDETPDSIKVFMKDPIFESAMICFSYLKRNSSLWTYVNFFKDNQKEFPESQLTRVFSDAGELAETERNKEAALQYYLLAFRYSNSDRVLDKILALDKSAVPESAQKSADSEMAKEAVISESEKNLYSKFDKQQKLSNYISSIEKAVDYLKKYPDGHWAESVSEKVSNIYDKIAASRSDKLVLARKKAIDKMSTAPEDYLYEWSRSMFYRERYEDVIQLLKPYVSHADNPAEVKSDILLQLGLSLLHSASFKESQKFFQLIIDDHSGSDNFAEALFRSALLNYRIEQYEAAISQFQKYLSIQKDGDFEVSSMYWMWRAQQKIKSVEADKSRDKLVQDYPLSYFGLRASVEAEKIDTVLPSNPLKNIEQIELSLSPKEEKIWRTIKQLISASWLGEAKVELDSFSELATDAKSQVFMSKLYRKAFYLKSASTWMWPALRLDPSLRVQENLMSIYPSLFEESIKTNVNRYGLNQYLIRGLIRQESSYHYRAQSSAGALGLMQILRPTAREIARDMRMKSFRAERDLFDPAINIKLGVNYVYRLMRAFSGNIPLALGSYNAGIGNIKAWLKNRQDLNPEQMWLESPDSELWIDELPWLETSGYIKNVQRNWVVYNLLDDPTTKVVFPIK